MNAARGRSVLVFAVAMAACIMGCSWTHHVRIENASSEAIEVTYKLSCPEVRCFFPDSAVVKPTRQRDAGTRAVYHLDRSDSTISFRLPPGHVADLASIWNTTYTYIHTTTSEGAPRDNLVWIRITGPKGTIQRTAAEFLQAANTKRSGVTLLRFTS